MNSKHFTKWQYLVVDLESLVKNELEKKLNAWGKAGWELIYLEKGRGFNSDRFVFKKPKLK